MKIIVPLSLDACETGNRGGSQSGEENKQLQAETEFAKEHRKMADRKMRYADVSTPSLVRHRLCGSLRKIIYYSGMSACQISPHKAVRGGLDVCGSDVGWDRQPTTV